MPALDTALTFLLNHRYLAVITSGFIWAFIEGLFTMRESLAYWLSLGKRFCVACIETWVRELLTTVLLIVVTFVTDMSRHDAQALTSLKHALVAALFVLIFWAAYNVFRTPWLLHRDGLSQGTANLLWHTNRPDTIGVQGHVWSPRFYQAKFHCQLIGIKNEPKEKGIVGTAHVRAQIKFLSGYNHSPISPLVWLESDQTAIEIGAGEARELIVAIRGSSADKEMWDFVVGGQASAAESLYVPLGDFEFEIRLIDAVNGRIIPVTPKIHLKWEWPDPKSGRRNPHMRQILMQQSAFYTLRSQFQSFLGWYRGKDKDSCDY